VEDQPAAARGGVERLLQAPEADLPLGEPLGERDQVLGKRCLSVTLRSS